MKRTSQMMLAGLWACLVLTSCFRSAAKSTPALAEGVPVRAARAVSEDVPVEISSVGNVEALDRVDVKSHIAGQIKSVVFAEGQNVAKGELLFTMDLDALARQAAEQQAELERDIAMEEQARAVAARDAASLKQSQSEADVGLELARDGIFAKQRADQLITARETAEAALRSDQAADEAAMGTIKADRARLAQTQLQLSFTNVTAPISGRAGAVMVKAGNMVRDNDTTLVTLLQLAPIYVTFGVREQVLPEVQRLNARKQLTVEASDSDGPGHEGRLVFVDNSVDATTGTIRLKAAFPNSDGVLWPGEFVHVRLRLRMEYGKTVIPEAAIQDGQEGKYVWRLKAGLATIARVNVARIYKPETAGGQAIVTGGINPGDVVITEGQLRLTPGAKAALIEPAL